MHMIVVSTVLETAEIIQLHLPQYAVGYGVTFSIHPVPSPHTHREKPAPLF